MKLYKPDPNPPCKPKECQNCGGVVDGERTEGWWLERDNWQNPNTHILFCITCCIEKMNEWPNYPDIEDRREVFVELTGERRPVQQTQSPDVTEADVAPKSKERSE